MEKLHTDKKALDEIVPGLLEAYDELTVGNELGIFTSSGSFFSHTFFGRDVAMSAKFVANFDHQTALKVIYGLMRFQGVKNNPITQEEPGRIHHELRDFKVWRGRLSERLALRIVGHFWGMKHGVLKTYFSADSTANYIRLVNKYCHNIDTSLLDKAVDVGGRTVTVGESLEAAADWLVSQVDNNGHLMTRRVKRSLPFQTFQDSVTAYAWSDGLIANYRRPHSFVEVQAFAADALDDTSRLLAGRNPKAVPYKETSHRMRRAILSDYWDIERSFFSSLLSERDRVLKLLDVPNISAGWTLNTSWWDEVAVHDRSEKISAIINRLFSDEFLTDVGLRTRSKYSYEPLGGTVDYHGAQTVWPMFNFMIIEGLRRHKMFRLARQLEHRLINGCNVVKKFPEFFIVDKETGRMQLPIRDHTLPKITAQMIPEKNIAFTVVPLLNITRSIGQSLPKPVEGWQAELEEDVLSRITHIPLVAPDKAIEALQPRRVYLKRSSALLRSIHRYGIKEVKR